MQVAQVLIELGLQISSMVEIINRLELKVESLEHYSNQSSILVDTLGNIMKEIESQGR